MVNGIDTTGMGLLEFIDENLFTDILDRIAGTPPVETPSSWQEVQQALQDLARVEGLSDVDIMFKALDHTGPYIPPEREAILRAAIEEIRS